MKRVIFLMTVVLIFTHGNVTAQDQVSNIRIQRQDTLLYVTYNLAATADIELFVSFDNGINYIGPLQHVSGAAGKGVFPGENKIIVWNVVKELGHIDYSNVVIKIDSYTVASSSAFHSINETEIETETPLLFTFRRNVYKEGWEPFKFERSRTQKIYMESWKLNKSEVQSLMKENSPELRMFEKGIINKYLGITFVSIGWPSTYYFGFGYPLLITGEVFMSISEDYLINAVNMHNNKYNKIPTFETELRLYDKGLNYRRRGLQILPFGGALTVVGAIFLYEYYPYGYHAFEEVLSGAATALGIGLTITGCKFLSKSKKYMKSAVNTYNSNINKNAGIEYDFGFTGNGAGMVVRF